MNTPLADIDAERSVLGAIILNNDALAIALELLPADGTAFFEATHRIVFRAMVELDRTGRPIDSVTLLGALTWTLDNAASTIAELSSAVPTSANAEVYAKTVRDAATLRQTLDICRTSAMSIKSNTAPAELLDDLESKLFALRGDAKERPQEISNLLEPWIERLQLLADGNGAPGVASGIRDLDAITGGFRENELVIVAARPSVGKTAVALNIAHHAAWRERVPTLVFSLEMAAQDLLDRLAGIHSGMPSEAIRHGGAALRSRLDDISIAARDFQSMPIAIQDRSHMTAWDIRGDARSFARKHGGKCLVLIDYLQLISAENKRDTRYIQIGNITRALKRLARELSAPVVLCAQLGRSAEDERDPYRMLAHLRESGDVEQDADVVLILSRLTEKEEEKLLNENPSAQPKNVLSICVAKNRNGRTGRVFTYFDRGTQRVLNAASQPADMPLPDFSDDDTLAETQTPPSKVTRVSVNDKRASEKQTLLMAFQALSFDNDEPILIGDLADHMGIPIPTLKRQIARNKALAIGTDNVVTARN